MKDVCRGAVPIADTPMHLVEHRVIEALHDPIQTGRREEIRLLFRTFPNRNPRVANANRKDGTMKLVIAVAAVLSSAALTVPTVTDLGDTKSSEARQVAALLSDEKLA